MIEQKIIQKIDVSFSFPVFFTKDIFTPNNNIFVNCIKSKEENKKHKVFFIVDENVSCKHSNLINEIREYTICHSPFINCVDILPIPGGEKTKNQPELIATIQNLIEKYKICKHSFVVGIGGGAVLDMVGYAAATPHRGVRHIRIPTTVLSQNDSGVGIKNAVNAYSKKNFLGTFAPPFAVINDSSFLTTLSDRDWISGISEAVKVAIIKDKDFFTFLEKNADALKERNIISMEHLIFRCADLHLEHIRTNGDPFELGYSRPLDFGHWAAHKIEALSNYSISHGEAVAVGIALDSFYAWKKQYISEEVFTRITNVLHKVGFPLFYTCMENNNLLDGLEEFREHLGGELCITLPDGLGKKIEVSQMDASVIVEAIEFLQKTFA